METFATAPPSTAPPMASMRSVTPRRSSASGDDAARTSTTSTSVDCENAIEVCRARGLSRLIYTSSFLALPPAGHERPIDGERLPTYQGRRAARRPRCRRDRHPAHHARPRRHLRAGLINRRQPRRAASFTIICDAGCRGLSAAIVSGHLRMWTTWLRPTSRR